MGDDMPTWNAHQYLKFIRINVTTEPQRALCSSVVTLIRVAAICSSATRERTSVVSDSSESFLKVSGSYPVAVPYNGPPAQHGICRCESRVPPRKQTRLLPDVQIPVLSSLSGKQCLEKWLS